MNSTSATADGLRERARIEGCLAEWLTQHVYSELGTFAFGAGAFKTLYAEEAAALGYDEDDPVILLRREADGRVFEAGIDITVRPVPADPIVVQDPDKRPGRADEEGRTP